MADASHPHLLLIMSVALAFSGVSQTAAMENDSCKLLSITAREEREDDFVCTGGRQADYSLA